MKPNAHVVQATGGRFTLYDDALDGVKRLEITDFSAASYHRGGPAPVVNVSHDALTALAGLLAREVLLGEDKGL